MCNIRIVFSGLSQNLFINCLYIWKCYTLILLKCYYYKKIVKQPNYWRILTVSECYCVKHLHADCQLARYCGKDKIKHRQETVYFWWYTLNAYTMVSFLIRTTMTSAVLECFQILLATKVLSHKHTLLCATVSCNKGRLLTKTILSGIKNKWLLNETKEH